MKPINIALIGNPNSGKTQLFNKLTAGCLKVANWSGVTVEAHYGTYVDQGLRFNIVDLPGCYALGDPQYVEGLDEQVTQEFIKNSQADFIINVIDSMCVERHLYLSMQLLELGVPMVAVFNKIDALKQQGREYDFQKIKQELGCSVVALSAKYGDGLNKLQQVLREQFAENTEPDCYAKPAPMPANIEILVKSIAEKHKQYSRYQCLAYLISSMQTDDGKANSQFANNKLDKHEQENIDIMIADARYGHIDRLVSTTSKQCQQGNKLGAQTERIDRIILNRWLGVPIFLGMMYFLFFFSVGVGSCFQEFFMGLTTLVIIKPIYFMLQVISPEWLTKILSDSLGQGLLTTVSFIPIIFIMFFILNIFESSGYMPRAAFVVDKLMCLVGLPGRSFVALMVGLGCNVPAVMATRSLSAHRDRVLTALMVPFMSCTARLSIYAVFSSVFFAHAGHNIIFLLFLIGIVVSIFTGLLLRLTLLPDADNHLLMELPLYQMPDWSWVWQDTVRRMVRFIKRAGRLILPMAFILQCLCHIDIHGNIMQDTQTGMSILMWLGQKLTILFHPIGLTQDNWPATVGLLSGIWAKEVVIGTLNTLYGHTTDVISSQLFTPEVIWHSFQDIFYSIFTQLMQLPRAIWHPLAAVSELSNQLEVGASQQMLLHFHSSASVFAYLLFILLYFPCVSTLAVIKSELGKSWAILSLTWSTFLAYGVSTLFYQFATFYQHPLTALVWLLVSSLAILGVIVIARVVAGSGKNSAVNLGEQV